ncbi:hypothetical protein B0H15DRAFT_817089 [Mycena belliarum]|uniref:EthD domain-containing protein n=1 Tax=Mycena belliarum TaxID=1033014 RepID=A0AAD6UEB1_9AGAR|nr:hypothetical protein B0H15DRAFT_817089 [Mycena belliae]
MAPGFLLVTSEPGPEVTLDEFQDWYNNEHVPLRLEHLPSFLTGARFRAADALAPNWLAVYDIDDTAAFAHESYTRLRVTRSAREAGLVGRLALLDRRAYVLRGDSGEGATSSYAAGGGGGGKAPTPVVLTQWTDTAPGDPSAWKEKGVSGWVRTRTYECIDSLRSGRSVAPGPEAQRVPKYHELRDLMAAEDPALKATSAQSEESRLWALYRAYPSITQRNASVAEA